MSEESYSSITSVETVGVLKVIVQSAHIEPNLRRWCCRPPSAFVAVQATARTKIQPETHDPSWLEETFYILIKSAKQDVQLQVYDARRHRRDKLVGTASFSVGGGLQVDTQLPILKKRTGQMMGDLSCSLFYYPVNAGHSETVVVRLTLRRVEGLVLAAPTGGCNIFAYPEAKVKAVLRLDWDGPPVHATRNASLNGDIAVWESAHEFLCRNKSECVIYIEVAECGGGERVVGTVQVGLLDLVEVKRELILALSGSSGYLVASADCLSVLL